MMICILLGTVMLSGCAGAKQDMSLTDTPADTKTTRDQTDDKNGATGNTELSDKLAGIEEPVNDQSETESNEVEDMSEDETETFPDDIKKHEYPVEAEKVSISNLSEDECRAEIEQLRDMKAVVPANAGVLKDMARCVTVARILDERGSIFAKMDNDAKARLRSDIIDEVMWGESALNDAIPIEQSEGRYDADSLIRIEDAEALFRDVYGEENFTPTEYERVEDGYILLSFGDGDPWHLVEHMQYFEDEDFYLFTGPAFYEDNGGFVEFVGYADILFAKNPDSRYGATLLYGRYRKEKIHVVSVETSSELPATKGKSYSGMNLVDGDYSTVWAEGVSGTGLGEVITLHLDKNQPVYGITICNGYTADYDLYNNNGMLTDVDVNFGDKEFIESSVDGYAYEGYSSEDLAGCNLNRIELDEPVITDTITITINGAKKGSKYDDTCISEIQVY